MTPISSRISTLASLGDYLNTLPQELLDICNIAEKHNGWFDLKSQKTAIQAIATNFLNKEKLENFCNQYSFQDITHKKVAIIMAGNIPLVGIHDLICGILSGHQLQIKLSSKDDQLMKAIILKLHLIDNKLFDRVKIQFQPMKDFDGIIATGSDNSSNYFEEYFGKYPNIIRKSRTSIAVLTGNETKEELTHLGRDIFQYYGLGCRNVTKLFVPKGYDFKLFFEAMESYSSVIQNTKYKNNFDYNLTLFILNKIPYLTNDFLILTEDKSLQSRIGSIHYEEYSSLDTVNNYIIEQKNRLQVVVGQNFTPFGEAQTPRLNDFADNVDTMKFLLNL